MDKLLINPRALRTRRGAEIKVWLLCEDPVEPSDDQDFSKAVAFVDFFKRHVTKAAWWDPEKECMIVFCLGRKNRLKCWNLVGLGTATNVLSAPREVFRPAIVASATAIVLMHNHPSGDPAPSGADISVTREIRKAAQILGISFFDHIIVGNKLNDPKGLGYYSFHAAGF